VKVDPRIIDQMKAALPTELPGINTDPTGQHVLRGSAAQVKWAVTIRANALALTWTAEHRAKLERIVDASWWIANRTALPGMKYKEPSAAQMADTGNFANQEMYEMMGGKTAPLSNDEKFKQALPPSYVDRMTRLTDAERWAASVSQNPKLAEAAILAVLSRLYKEDAMRTALRSAAQRALEAANAAVDKDTDAIRRMLT